MSRVGMTEQPYDSEELLQRLLADYPDLLAGEQMSAAAPRRWLPIAREVAIPGEEGEAGRWFLDHLFIDQEGIPTLVEVKRSSDTRIRREVVGQLLEYAAHAATYLSAERLRGRFEAGLTEKGCDPDEVLREFLGADADPQQFWQWVETHLRAGRMRLVFVADEIPPELRRVVEFLNRQMASTEVLAVEVKQYVGQGLTTLVPRVLGQAVKPTASGGDSRRWNEERFFAVLAERNGPAEAEVARAILDWARGRQLQIWWGEGAKMGSFVPWFSHNGRQHQLFAVWTYASVEIYFYWYQFKPPFDEEAKRLELLHRLNAIPGVSIPPDAIARRPSFPLKLLAGPREREQFFAAFEWFLPGSAALRQVSHGCGWRRDEV